VLQFQPVLRLLPLPVDKYIVDARSHTPATHHMCPSFTILVPKTPFWIIQRVLRLLPLPCRMSL
jgi:hypothetical protein